MCIRIHAYNHTYTIRISNEILRIGSSLHNNYYH